MYWYHWIATYLIIIGAIIFTIIPEKPLWLWLVIVGCIGVGLASAVLPSKVDPVLQKSLEQREAKRRAEQEKSGD
ncbi:hypothetical protein AB3N02_13780 [Priestia aryabhattai]|uniref:hypothetical protein n=1 Tax=Priestia aryabhattai TaxID=412384 RepID=UPI00399F9CFB